MKVTSISQLICSFIITISLVLIRVNGAPRLYKGNDPGLTLLTSSNFSQFIFHKSNTFIVEFYNTWCGHCARFAPTWKGFAKDIRHWSSVVQVIAVDCADDANVQLCSDYDVTRFPTIRYFWHNYDYKINGQPFSTKIGSIDSLRQDYLDWLHRSWSQGVPQQWPQLNYIDPSNPDELANITSISFTRDVLILVEGEKSYYGREVILDLSPFLDTIVVRRIKTGHKWLEQLNESPLLLPVIIKISKGGKPVIIRRPDELSPDHRKAIVDTIMAEYNLTFKEMVIESAPSDSFKTLQENTRNQKSKTNDDGVYLDDLYLSIHETLYKQIPLHRQLDSDKLEIVKNFISILNDYFPFDSESAKSFISSLSKWLTTQVHGLSKDDYLSTLKTLNDQNPFPKPSNWITCAGSEPGYRGYPCSLWLLFHTLTVNEFMKTSGEPEGHKVLYTMRDYITNFFSCADCAKHFGKISSSLEATLMGPNSSIVWLWRVHNVVNRRLSKDITEDPVHPKLQYPSPVTCPTCWTPDGSRFNETSTFMFLLTRYRGDNLKKNSPSSYQANVILNKMDMSLCLFLYILTSCMLLTFCFVLSIRKKRRKEHKFRYPMAP